MKTQRQLYRTNSLDHDRTRRLTELPRWSWNIAVDAWEEGFLHLLMFVEREGHARVPDDTLEDEYPLGNWASWQRTQKRRGKLGRELANRLESLSRWSWDPLTDYQAEAYQCLLRFVEREGHAGVQVKDEEDGFPLGQWANRVRKSFRSGILDQQTIDRLERLPGWFWKPQEARWEEGFRHLVRFVEREGHTTMSSNYREGDYPLQSWVARQRHLYRKNQLDLNYVERLDNLPEWEWEPRDTNWEAGWRALQRFADREGHTLIPGSHIEDGFNLGRWAIGQKVRYRSGKLGEGEIKVLEELPGWRWDRQGRSWQSACTKLLAFVTREGHSAVPPNHIEDGFNLGRWVSLQRAKYRAVDLQADRVLALEELPGWQWEKSDPWEHAYSALLAFVDREGHARVPVKHIEGDFNLGSWVNTQRSTQKNGDLAVDRVKRLEALPGWAWGRTRSSWNTNYQGVVVYVDREGHARVPVSHIENGLSIGRWVSRQRELYRSGDLVPDRIRALEKIPGWWWGKRRN